MVYRSKPLEFKIQIKMAYKTVSNGSTFFFLFYCCDLNKNRTVSIKTVGWKKGLQYEIIENFGKRLTYSSVKYHTKTIIYNYA
jgi:hypothetical protein